MEDELAAMGKSDKDWHRQMATRLAYEKKYAQQLNEVILQAEAAHLTSKQRKKYFHDYAVDIGNTLNQMDLEQQAALKAAAVQKMPKEQINMITTGYNQQRQQLMKEHNISEAQVQQYKTIAANQNKQNEFYETVKVISKHVGNIQEQLAGAIQDGIDFATSSFGKFDTRMQGLSEKFADYSDHIQSTVGMSPFVSQRKLFQNVVDLADQGIIYNIEQRALISSLSDKLVTTFDAMDNTLTRLIRIQQADLTMSQLGAEATLTQFLNQKFGNTEYLGSSGGSGLYDGVYAALIDASAVMNKNQATSYAFNAQKWLGSMYSVGVSDAAIQSIAEGLGYIATGNVSALSSNSALQTLFAMSAKNAGLSYSSLLTSGATADDINKLLKAMTEYLQDISENTSNQVTRNAFSQLLNISMADLQAIRNLNSTDIADIYKTSTNYEGAVSEAKNQLGQVASRTSLGDALNTSVDNLFFNLGMDVTSNPETYGIWLVAQGLQSLTSSLGLGGEIGDIIGGVSGLLSILSVGRAALFGDKSPWDLAVGVLKGELSIKDAFMGGTLGDILSGDFGIGQSPLLNAGGFAWDEYTTRGSLLTSQQSSAGTSFSMMLSEGAGTGNGYKYDTSGNGINQVTENAYSLDKVNSVNDLYQELFVAQNAPIRVKLADIEMTALAELCVDDLHEIRQAFNQPISVVESGSGTLFEHEGDSAQDIIDTVQDVRNDRFDSNATNSAKARVNNYSWVNQF